MTEYVQAPPQARGIGDELDRTIEQMVECHRARGCYAAQWRSIDNDDFHALAGTGAILRLDVHYVLRHAVTPGGELSDAYSLVPAAEWSPILRGAEGECVKDVDGQWLRVVPVPALGPDDASAPENAWLDESCFVLQFDKPSGPVDWAFDLVRVRDWNVGMSRAVARQVCDARGEPLIVLRGPAAGKVLGCS